MSTMGIVNITGIADSRVAPVCADVIKENGGQVLIVTASYSTARRLATDMDFFTDKKIHLMPTDEERFLNYEAKNRDTMTARLRIMKELLGGEECVVIAPVSIALKKMPPAESFVYHGFTIEVSKDLSLQKAMTDMVDMGYERVPLVYAPGQFSLRGGILDIFTPYEELPTRIELFDTEVEDIRSFQVKTQRWVEKKKTIEILPAELPVRDDKAFARAAKKIAQAYECLPERRDQLLDSLDNLVNIQQMENYMDYLYEEPAHIWDYMKDVTVIVDDPNKVYETVEAAVNSFNADFEIFLEQQKVVGSDIKSHWGTKELLQLYDFPKVYICTPLPKLVKGVTRYEEVRNILSRPTLSYNGKLDVLERELDRYLQNSYKVTILCSTEDRYKNMKEFLATCNFDGRVWLKRGTLTSGIDFPEERVCYITDGDIFGYYKRHKRSRSTSKTKSQIIKSFADIDKGDYVVHEKHGIGQFIGIEQLEVSKAKKDYLKVRYAGDDYLYVPANQMNLIQKYIGKDVGKAKVSRLNGVEWRNTKARAKASILNMAKELLDISATRRANPGYAFEADTAWQKEFEEDFPFEETADQLRCIEEIKVDMESDRAMDRLLCGDVGYGKTEVAARAMFKCATEGKQVVVLVPTTILANQHYCTFKERFSKFPFTVEMLSRFKSEKEQKDIIASLKRGTVDVVVGTHRMLGKDVEFKDLGLLVIDEEQRFGVQHKEKIKSLRKNVDVLTLSATPIPRTLHMSLVGIRDMSLIEEPPEERYPVQTYAVEEDDFVIKEAIERELERGGQVYVVHNRVHSIHRVASYVDSLVPGKRIAVGHGRMDERELEDVMMAFMAGEIDVLVATTIIESGIDIPNVNTLIILDADKFGLSQLYQLRGRVGRSNRLAYAYLTHKKNQVLTELAERRLRAIREFTEFGAGFKISMRDLEIRGAGNLLGTEQHGHMVKIGYELYCKLVDDAVKALEGGSSISEREDTTIDLRVAAYIPENYIGDEIQKLTMYKKIASIVTDQDRAEVEEELLDRYGAITKETQNLITIAQIKALAEEMGIVKVGQKKEKLQLEYEKKSGIKPVTIFLTPGKETLLEILDIITAMAQKAS